MKPSILVFSLPPLVLQIISFNKLPLCLFYIALKPVATLTHHHDWQKLFDAFTREINYPELNEIIPTHRDILSDLLKKITEEDLQRIHRALQSQLTSQFGLQISCAIPDTPDKLEQYLRVWTTSMDVHMVNCLVETIKDKRKKDTLVKALKQHEEQLKKLSEESLTSLRTCQIELKTDGDVSHMIVELSQKEYLLSDLLKLKDVLSDTLKINPLLFKGYRDETLFAFQISSNAALLMAHCLLSNIPSLQQYSVTKILVRDLFVVDVIKGEFQSLVSIYCNYNVYALSMNMCKVCTVEPV